MAESTDKHIKPIQTVTASNGDDIRILLKYQADWCADLADVKFLEKSRRIGGTFGEILDDCLTAAGEIGDDIWYIGYNKEMAQEFIRAAAEFVRVLHNELVDIDEEIIEDENKDILTYVIKLASGHRVSALSSAPSNLRGKQGIIVIDEAAFHEDLEEVLKAALAMLIWGGKVRVISTHNGIDNTFAIYIKDIKEGRLPYSLHTVTFRDAIADGLYKRICLVSGKEYSPEAEDAFVESIYQQYGEAADEELDCIPKKSGKSYFNSAVVENNLDKGIPYLEFGKPDEWKLLDPDVRRAEITEWCEENLTPLLEMYDKETVWFGEDFARNGDATIFDPCFDDGDNFTSMFLLELRNIPFADQETFLFFILDRVNLGGAALDATGNGAQIAENTALRYGVDRVHEIKLNQKWYQENVPRYKTRLEDGTIRMADNQAVRDDHRVWVSANGVPTIGKRINSKGKKHHGDIVIAKVMAVYARNNIEVLETEVMSAAKREGYREAAYYG
ncbi:MAG: hypothetical protein AB7U93_13780 [Deferribacterales bacterium]